MADVNSTDLDNKPSLGPASRASLPVFKEAFNVVNNKAALEEQLELVKDANEHVKSNTREDLENVRAVNAGQSALSTTMAFTAVSNQRTKNSSAENSKKASADAMMLAILAQIRALEERIAAIEASLEDALGDAWREEIALRVLDDIPERMTGESIDDYRERLEETLIEKMIDPDTGEIKDEYKNHPDPNIRQAAEWAKQEYKLNDLEPKVEAVEKTLSDNTLSTAQKNQELAKAGFKEMVEADGTVDSDLASNAIENKADEFAMKVNISSELNSFLS